MVPQLEKEIFFINILKIKILRLNVSYLAMSESGPEIPRSNPALSLQFWVTSENIALCKFLTSS